MVIFPPTHTLLSFGLSVVMFFIFYLKKKRKKKRENDVALVFLNLIITCSSRAGIQLNSLSSFPRASA